MVWVLGKAFGEEMQRVVIWLPIGLATVLEEGAVVVGGFRCFDGLLFGQDDWASC